MEQNNRPLGWTTLEEAKQLVEAGLPVETADMCYPHFIRGGANSYDTNPVPCSSLDYPYEIPCWSLGVLISLLPLRFQSKEGFSYEYYLNFDILLDEIKLTYYIKQIRYGHPMVAEKCETLIEACVEIICWLLKNKYHEWK